MRLLHSTITCSPRSLTLIVCYNDFITPLFHSLFTDRSNTALQQYRVCCTIKRNNYTDKRSHVANIQKILPQPRSQRRIFKRKTLKKLFNRYSFIEVQYLCTEQIFIFGLQLIRLGFHQILFRFIILYGISFAIIILLTHQLERFHTGIAAVLHTGISCFRKPVQCTRLAEFLYKALSWCCPIARSSSLAVIVLCAHGYE